MNKIYPPVPSNIPANVDKPSAQFKRHITMMVLTLIVFTVIYLALLVVGIVAAGCIAVFGGTLMLYIHNFIGIGLGLGLIVAGLMILYFMIKFIFERKKEDKAHYTEIFENDYPDLFEFIRHISAETGTHFPRHIYITYEVNAFVFYDSTFLSMFLPVKKNLVIGLGLVNMINLSEFKAVIAHEFGHFSQKSMRAGSYVYQANRVIHNMLYENESYGHLLNRWARIHRLFAMCARLTVNVIHAIQWVQKQAYKLVNKQYSALSRQMEFHADTISAMAAGGNNAIHALHRLEFADACYNNAITQYNQWVSKNLKGQNIYADQRVIAAYMAEEYKLPMHNGLPELVGQQNVFKNHNKVRIENQWASHPTLAQRENALNDLNITGDTIHESPWMLFPDAQALQKDYTNKLYAKVKFPAEPTVVSNEFLDSEIRNIRAKNALPSVYDAFYKNRKLSVIDVDKVTTENEPIENLNDFCMHNALGDILISIQKDLQLLQHIEANQKTIKSFSYDGDNMSSKYASSIKISREKDLVNTKSSLQKLDERVYLHFLLKAKGQSEYGVKELKNYYRYYHPLIAKGEENLLFCNSLHRLVQPFYTEIETVTSKMVDDLKDANVVLNKKIEETQQFLDKIDVPYKFHLPQKTIELKDEYISFEGEQDVFSKSLDILNEAMRLFGIWNAELEQACLSKLLEYQLKYN